MPTNDSYDRLAAAPQYFIYARGPLEAPGVLGAHFHPKIEYPYGGIDIALSPIFDHNVDGWDPEASLRKQDVVGDSPLDDTLFEFVPEPEFEDAFLLEEDVQEDLPLVTASLIVDRP